MRWTLVVLVLALATVLPATSSRAQSEGDRLRDALRAATAQVRALEDQRAAMQAKQAEDERDKGLLRKQLDAAKARAKESEEALRKAVDDFNARLAERDDTLEKWKAAYAEAADVARAKDAERARFEGEAAAFKARTKSCEKKNAKLIRIGNEVLESYRDLTPVDQLAIHEIAIGFARVSHENRVQAYRTCILDQDVKLPDVSADVGAADQKPAEAAPPQGQQRQGAQKPKDGEAVTDKDHAGSGQGAKP